MNGFNKKYIALMVLMGFFVSAIIFFITPVPTIFAITDLKSTITGNQTEYGKLLNLFGGNTVTGNTPVDIVVRIINFLFGFLGFLLVVLLIYGGFLWMTASGEEEKVETAQTLIKDAVIGITIIIASWLVAVFVVTQIVNLVYNRGGGGTINSGGSGGGRQLQDTPFPGA